MITYHHSALHGVFPTAIKLLFTLLSLGIECQVLEDTKNLLGPVPLYPAVSFQVLNVDHLLLRDSSQGLVGNSSLQTQRQAFLVTSSGAGLLPPTVNASYGPLTADRIIPTDLLLSGRRILPVLLARTVRSSAPIVRILFHLPTGRDVGEAVRAEAEEQRPGGRKGGAGDRGAYCVTAYAFWQTREVRGACLVSPGGFCVAQLKPEPAWFSPASRSASSRERGAEDAQGNPVEVYFQSRKDQTGQCVPQDSLQRVGLGRGVPQGSGTPLRRIGSVNLLKAPPGNPTFLRLRLGGAVVVQTSSKPLKTTDVATFYVFLSSASSIESFTLRATVRKGLSFSRARPSDSALWDIVLEPGRGAALNTISVVCLRKVAITGKRGLLEVLQLDFETKDLTDQSESQVITWRLELPGNTKDVGIMKIYTTQQDYVGLAPMVMSADLLNTAVLTGKMASVPVKILAVEIGGSVTDVTNYTSCATTQEDILKVSERCDYVYVNGKETRGRMKMLLNFTYSYLSAQLEMSVWMPRLPLLIDVGDPELSQIKGWRVPVAAGSRRTTWDSEEEEEMRKGRGCMLQYQHTVVRVLTPFMAESSNPGAEGGAGPLEYFLGADWQVDVTRQVRYSLRVTDTAVARLQAGTVLQGRAVGITSIQVLSPLSASVLAERSIKVLDDKVSVTELGVQLVSALALSLQLSPGSNRAIVATATTQEVMTSPKQEAVVSCWVRFSDGAVVPLDLFDRAAYSLTVTSADESVAAVRRTPQSAFVVAKGEGEGLLVRAELRICEECQKSKRKSKLAVGGGVLKVVFQTGRREDDGGTAVANAGGAVSYGGEGSEAKEETKGVSTTASSVDKRRFRSTLPETSTVTTRRAQQELAGAGTAAISITTSTTTTAAPRVPTGKPGTAKPPGTGRPLMTGRPSVDKVTGKGPGQRRDWANMLDNPNPLLKKEMPKPDLEPKKDQPKGKPPRVVESNLVRTFRSMTDLELGIYALVGVSCVAILAFLLNCASHRLCFRGHKTPVQAPDPRDPKDHKHDWVWLGSASAQAQCNPPQASCTLKRENHLSVESHHSIDSHRSLEASLSTVSSVPERTATLGRRTSSQNLLGMDLMANHSATLLAKPQRNEPLHSPTSKRNQVQFTTFTTLDIKHLAALKKNGVDFNWASEGEARAEPPQHLPDMPWPVVKPLGERQ